jgi:hypothetical protein
MILIVIQLHIVVFAIGGDGHMQASDRRPVI